MDYGQSMISQIERGAKQPSALSLLKVAIEYGVTLEWLYGRIDDLAPNIYPQDRMNGGHGHIEEVEMTRDRDKKCKITPEEAIANYELIMSEPMLSLKLKGGNLSVEDMADIADYIRYVGTQHAESENDEDDQSRKD